MDGVCCGITFVISLKCCLAPLHISAAMFSMLHHFIIPGKHVSYKHLEYKPQHYSTIAAISSNHVMVAQEHPPDVHIHQLPGGETVRTVSHQQLGLSNGDWLKGINFTGLLMHLAVGKKYTTTSLLTYKVQYTLV